MFLKLFLDRLIIYLTFYLTRIKIWTKPRTLAALIEISESDKKFRSKPFDKQFLDEMKSEDIKNHLKVSAIVKRWRWPFDDFITNEYSTIIFFVIQHSSLNFQLQQIENVKKAAELGKIKASNVALLTDRIAIQKGELQIYGTQVYKNLATGKVELFDIFEPERLEERRQVMGLQPITEYLSIFSNQAD